MQKKNSFQCVAGDQGWMFYSGWNTSKHPNSDVGANVLRYFLIFAFLVLFFRRGLQLLGFRFNFFNIYSFLRTFFFAS
jgi:hypothetical protein